MAYLDSYTKENVKDMITVWYPANASTMEVNEKLLAVVAKILKESSSCSSTMKWVPVGGNPVASGVSVATTAGLNYAKTLVKDAKGKQTYSASCVKAVALKYKNEALQAGQGW